MRQTVLQRVIPLEHFHVCDTRKRCSKCGWYFAPDDGAGAICFDCFAPEPDDPEPFAFLPPVPPAATDKEISLERELTRTKQALYFLQTALEGISGPSLPSPHQVITAMAIFKEQFPEFK